MTSEDHMFVINIGFFNKKKIQYEYPVHSLRQVRVRAAV